MICSDIKNNDLANFASIQSSQLSGLIRSPSNTNLVLFFQNFAGVRLLVGHINALETVDVLGKTGLGDVSLPGLDGLHQGVVDEDVLLLSLDEAVPLFPDMLEVGEDVQVGPGDDLLQHGVDHNVAASPTNTGTERERERVED